MGEFNLVSRDFSDQALVAMAGMRNMLVHNYSEIDQERFYNTLRNHLGDVEKFLQSIKQFLENPKKFGLEVS